MQTTGAAILAHALQPITGASEYGDTLDLDVLAARSAFLLDTLNLSRTQLGELSQEARAVLPAGGQSILWGPTGSVRAVLPDGSLAADPAPAPSEIARWTFRRPADTYAWRPPVRPADDVAWEDRLTIYGNFPSGGEPHLLRFDQSFDSAGNYPLRIYPSADREYEISLYGYTPPLERIDNDARPVNLPRGVAAYLSAALAMDAALAFGFPQTAGMINALAEASDRLEGRRETRIQRVNPRWLMGDGWDRVRAGVDVGF